jgi:hypothetical protein
VETTANILTIKEVADILRCSKTHAQNVIEGKVNGLPKLTHLSLGRRKVVRKEWLDQWMEAEADILRGGTARVGTVLTQFVIEATDSRLVPTAILLREKQERTRCTKRCLVST